MKPLACLLGVGGVLLGLHEVLHWVLWDGDWIAVLLSPGAHTPVGPLLAATAFLALRLLLLLVLPPALLTVTVYSWAKSRQKEVSFAGPNATPSGRVS